MTHNHRILVVRPDALGDAVLIFPMLTALRECVKNIHITVLVHPTTEPLFRNQPLVDQVIVDLNSQKKRWWGRHFFDYVRYIRRQNFDSVSRTA